MVTISVHTSDRGLYKVCRRRWHWGSHMSMGLTSRREEPHYFWVGSGVHYALQDYHGYNFYRHPALAFVAYAKATLLTDEERVPFDWQEHMSLAVDMMMYYADVWLPNRPERWVTHWVDDVPQVEVTFRIPLNSYMEPNVLRALEEKYGEPVEVWYEGTIDRVAIDSDGKLWIFEYKTRAQFQRFHLAMDSQVSAYCWGGSCIYPYEIAGVVYQQHLKHLPETPRILQSGQLSTDKRQNTDHTLYRQALIKQFGKVERAPTKFIDCLNTLLEGDTQDTNKWIRRDLAYRSDAQIEAEAAKVHMEINEMLNPETPIYPHPTTACGGCEFNEPCYLLDDAGDWEGVLGEFERRDEEYNPWKPKLLPPKEMEQLYPKLLSRQQMDQLSPSLQAA